MSSVRHDTHRGGSNVSLGQDNLHPKLDLTMKDLYAIQKEIVQYVNTEELLPKLIARGMLSDSEVYTVKNPYLPPNQRIFELLRFISNKGPDAPSRLLECLTEKPLIPGHMFLASRLTGSPRSEDASLKSSGNFEVKPNPAVSKKIGDLKFLFADLLLETHRYLKTNKIEVEEFRIFVSFMSASTVNSSSLFFHDHLPSLSTASTIDQMFAIINENKYWNHFNYHLLEAVIKKFCGQSIQAKLEKYIEEVVRFENTVTLSEYTVAVPPKLTIPSKPDFAVVKTKLTSEHHWDTYKLSQTRSLRSRMHQELNIPEHALLFQTAEVGSVIIKWLVPVSVKDSIHVCALSKQSQLLSIGILSIQLDSLTLSMEDKASSNYENLTAMVPYGGNPAAILKSLESLQGSVEQFSLTLHKHKQMMSKIPSTSSSTTAEPRNADIVKSKSVSHWSQSSTGTAVAGSRTTSIAASSDYDRSLTGPKVRSTTLPSSETSPITTPTTSNIKQRSYFSRDDSEEEYYADHWINKDSGYCDPVEWRNH